MLESGPHCVTRLLPFGSSVGPRQGDATTRAKVSVHIDYNDPRYALAASEILRRHERGEAEANITSVVAGAAGSSAGMVRAGREGTDRHHRPEGVAELATCISRRQGYRGYGRGFAGTEDRLTAVELPGYVTRGI